MSETMTGVARAKSLDAGLSGQRVLVTAGAAGIGLAVVERLLAHEASVFVCDVSEATLHSFIKANPQAGDQHPSALYVEYCAKCHGQDGTGNTPRGKQLMARDFTDAEWQSSKKDDQLIKQVREGSEDMPAFGKKLSKEQIEGLVKNDVRGFAKKG